MLREVEKEVKISIHALLAESDAWHLRSRSLGYHFNPRSPCGERLGSMSRSLFLGNFNPRSPCGERPVFFCAKGSIRLFQSTLSLRRATWAECGVLKVLAISIHALLAESDIHMDVLLGKHAPFQSTLSLRRATYSIGSVPEVIENFNPRSPCGERLDYAELSDWAAVFQSTLSLRRATIRRNGVSNYSKEFQSTLSLRRATANTTKLALSFLSKVPI